MNRCFTLARRGTGAVSPNPLVGAILVHGGRIIGEGYHARYGGPHAEVNCLASVSEQDREYVQHSTLYVSLEPCCIYGRTPPCTDLIIRHQIPRVVASVTDATAEVNGRGVSLLRAAGVEVTIGILAKEGRRLVAPREVFVTLNRPYILLKYAQSADGRLAPADPAADGWITSPLSRRYVHRLRAATGAILIGARTLVQDDPALDIRYGESTHRLPLAVVWCTRPAELPPSRRLWQRPPGSLLLAAPGPLPSLLADRPGDFLSLPADPAGQLDALLAELHRRRINHLTVEGGAATLRAFIAAGHWDEVLQFTGTSTWFGNGPAAPTLPGPVHENRSWGADRVIRCLAHR
ncbi:MAG: bifunctional diaminohydroxyphosphoribosylaminopyrimidine deaminase/5-amino-6-(5-phosphoribosylamino)uracil reductase RibD [Saprospiraceae bacterium]